MDSKNKLKKSLKSNTAASWLKIRVHPRNPRLKTLRRFPLCALCGKILSCKSANPA